MPSLKPTNIVTIDHSREQGGVGDRGLPPVVPWFVPDASHVTLKDE